MKVVFTASFLKRLSKLPKVIQVKMDKQVALLYFDMRDPRLHTKKLQTGHSVPVYCSGADNRLMKKYCRMGGNFKAEVICYTSKIEIQKKDLKRLLKKAQDIQWDYKNILKRKGVLERSK